jgi:hypothetical protein
MADVFDDSTGWVPFFEYCRRRATRIVPDTAREQEAERLTLEEVLERKLELWWRDVDGREYVGLPLGFSRWATYYDPSADAIRKSPFGGRALYEPRVRERQRKLDKPTDEVVAPESPPAALTTEPSAAPVPPVAPETLEGTERWVYEQMCEKPPRKGDHGYVQGLFDRRPERNIKKKTIANNVSKYRKRIEKP